MIREKIESNLKMCAWNCTIECFLFKKNRSSQFSFWRVSILSHLKKTIPARDKIDAFPKSCFFHRKENARSKRNVSNCFTLSWRKKRENMQIKVSRIDTENLRVNIPRNHYKLGCQPGCQPGFFRENPVSNPVRTPVSNRKKWKTGVRTRVPTRFVTRFPKPGF